jgi:hypothetical protein
MDVTSNYLDIEPFEDSLLFSVDDEELRKRPEYFGTPVGKCEFSCTYAPQRA